MKYFLLLACVLIATSATAQQKTAVEKLLTDQKGYFTCTGAGSSSPLFNRECNKLNISRVSSGGSIKYEGTCIDSNTTTFFLACDAITLEYSMLTPQKNVFGD